MSTRILHPTELFPIYQNKHLTIRRRDDHIAVPSSNRIKSKIDSLIESYFVFVLLDVQANLPETSSFFVCPNGFGEYFFWNFYSTWDV